MRFGAPKSPAAFEQKLTASEKNAGSSRCVSNFRQKIAAHFSQWRFASAETQSNISPTSVRHLPHDTSGCFLEMFVECIASDLVFAATQAYQIEYAPVNKVLPRIVVMIIIQAADGQRGMRWNLDCQVFAPGLRNAAFVFIVGSVIPWQKGKTARFKNKECIGIFRQLYLQRA